MSRYKLLCTFSNTDTLDSTLDLIEEKFTYLEKIFIFANSSNSNEKYLTFNIDITQDQVHHNFISIHRKKETNTMYSVNAVNVLVKQITGGEINPRVQLDWESYRNSLLLTKRQMINVIPLVLEEIVRY